MAVKERKGTLKERLRQQSIRPWPKKLDGAVATVRPEPEELAEQLHIRFTESHDHLDRLQAAIVVLPSGQRMGLVRHIDCPSPGTEVWLEKSQPLDGALAAMSLDFRDVLWSSPQGG